MGRISFFWLWGDFFTVRKVTWFQSNHLWDFLCMKRFPTKSFSSQSCWPLKVFYYSPFPLNFYRSHHISSTGRTRRAPRLRIFPQWKPDTWFIWEVYSRAGGREARIGVCIGVGCNYMSHDDVEVRWPCHLYGWCIRWYQPSLLKVPHKPRARGMWIHMSVWFCGLIFWTHRLWFNLTSK